jgi:hypothetical protein
MSWLEERELVAEYRCKHCGQVEYMRFQARDPVPEAQYVMACANALGNFCAVTAEDESPRACAFEFKGTLPYKLGGLARVEYEHNGRKGIRITDSHGGVQHRAKSKDTYMRTGKIPADVPQTVDSRTERESVAKQQFLQGITQ